MDEKKYAYLDEVISDDCCSLNWVKSFVKKTHKINEQNPFCAVCSHDKLETLRHEWE